MIHVSNNLRYRTIGRWHEYYESPYHPKCIVSPIVYTVGMTLGNTPVNITFTTYNIPAVTEPL